MFNLKDFNGTLISEPYMANSFEELERQLLKEIVFYGSGFGWSTASNEAEEHYILFPYAKKESDEPSEGYIDSLKILLSSEIHYRHRAIKTFNPIKDFSWNIEATDNKDFFVLSVFKM